MNLILLIFVSGESFHPLLYLSFQQFSILCRISYQIFIFAAVPPFFVRWDSGRTGCITLCRASNLPPYFSHLTLLSKLINHPTAATRNQLLTPYSILTGEVTRATGLSGARFRLPSSITLSPACNPSVIT